MKIIRKALIMIIAVIVITACLFFLKQIRQNRMLKQVIARLKADSRVAEVLVTGVKKDESGRELTTIKFLEYDSAGKPLPPQIFYLPRQSYSIPIPGDKIRRFLRGKRGSA